MPVGLALAGGVPRAGGEVGAEAVRALHHPPFWHKLAVLRHVLAEAAGVDALHECRRSGDGEACGFGAPESWLEGPAGCAQGWLCLAHTVGKREWHMGCRKAVARGLQQTRPVCEPRAWSWADVRACTPLWPCPLTSVQKSRWAQWLVCSHSR